ncbi:hypothetical protein ILYODFUR_029426 [Ilyodon furcidens]|uniref:Secreted protein n=1 Tax=Ilyodon furcidens TaxID=33524 RepID=A0ABV0TC19_9TELE
MLSVCYVPAVQLILALQTNSCTSGLVGTSQPSRGEIEGQLLDVQMNKALKRTAPNKHPSKVHCLCCLFACV